MEENLNQGARAVFHTLIAGLTPDNPATRFDINNYWPECNGGIMAVHVEKIFSSIAGNPCYSITHYFKSNGDMVPDPDMVFMVKDCGAVFPVSYQSSMGAYFVAIREIGGKINVVNPEVLLHLIEFANMWMDNIKIQQDLSV